MPLFLDDLSKPEFWKSVGCGTGNHVSLTVVLPTGRHRSNQSGHLALASDGMYAAEIATAIASLARNADLDGVRVRSILDIDFAEHLQVEQEAEDGDCCLAKHGNLLVLATPDVNVVSEKLLTACRSTESYGVGYSVPYGHCQIIGGRGTVYTERSHPNVGVLALYENPWCEEGRRIAMFSGGIHATGTMGASRLLLGYVRSEFTGNNKYKNEVPVRILDVPRRRYKKIELLDEQQCIPQHDVRGIVDEELNIFE